MRNWSWGTVVLLGVGLTASCRVEKDDDDGKAGAGGDNGETGGTANGGSSTTGGATTGGSAGLGGAGDETGGTGNPDAGSTGIGGEDGASGAGGGPSGSISFTPSNVPASVLPGDAIGDMIFGGDFCGSASAATINTDTGAIGSSCSLKAGTHFVYAKVEQSDGSNIAVFIANDIRIEQTMNVSVLGQLPLVLVALDSLQIIGKLDASGAAVKGVGGGFAGVFNVSQTLGNGPGGGGAGKVGGGGSYCGRGGKSSTNTTGGGTLYSTPAIVPLIGGSSGGSGGIWDSGAGGGAIQLIAGTSIQISTTGVINTGGGGGGQTSCGGGSGGAILLEAPTVTVAGTLAANGGGGGTGSGALKGQNGLPSDQPAPGAGTDAKGGDGSAGIAVDGENGTITGTYEGGGGGGAGVIRINTTSGSATITGKLSPGLDTDCATQGTLL